MPIGSDDLPELHPIAGFKLGVASAGIKQAGRKDLVIMAFDHAASVSATFTQNAFCAAPVQVAKQHLSENSPSYFIVNTGNANAGTGEQGLADAKTICQSLADTAGTSVESIIPFSTGVIGELLPVDTIVNTIPTALADLSENNWAQAAEGIMTTDTRPKAASRKVMLDGVEVSITGISKGAGMIKPNMATMLAYVATDAVIAKPVLDSLISHAVSHSFNRITVDGDTSTNDACMLVATGTVEQEPISSVDDERYGSMLQSLTELFIELAQAIIRDAEGVTKFITVDVQSGKTETECLQVAYTIAESPLVKTALFASDPNWGRLLAAIGRAGLDQLDVNDVSLYINDVLIAENGSRAVSYTEEQGVAAMAGEEITIRVELARGAEQASVWTSDLSYDYVRINADYRT